MSMSRGRSWRSLLLSRLTSNFSHCCCGPVAGPVDSMGIGLLWTVVGVDYLIVTFDILISNDLKNKLRGDTNLCITISSTLTIPYDSALPKAPPASSLFRRMLRLVVFYHRRAVVEQLLSRRAGCRI